MKIFCGNAPKEELTEKELIQLDDDDREFLEPDYDLEDDDGEDKY